MPEFAGLPITDLEHAEAVYLALRGEDELAADWVGTGELSFLQRLMYWCGYVHGYGVGFVQRQLERPPSVARFLLYLVLPLREQRTFPDELNDMHATVALEFGLFWGRVYFWRMTLSMVWAYTRPLRRVFGAVCTALGAVLCLYRLFL